MFIAPPPPSQKRQSMGAGRRPPLAPGRAIEDVPREGDPFVPDPGATASPQCPMRRPTGTLRAP